MKLLISVVLLIALALVAGSALQFNPVIVIFVILGFGIFMVGRWDTPDLPPGNQTHWGSGQGIYFGRDDVWVSGSDSGEVSGAKADEAALRDKTDAEQGKS